MMGERTTAAASLFYEFSLEQHVPSDHLLRAIDRFVDLSGIRAHLRPFYSELGRPSIDPELMIRMLIIGYCFGIRSERRLCEEVHLNLAYRWFCRLGLDGDVPDHSTFSKNRHGRFRDSDLLRQLFETTVRRCIAEGLVGGEGFATDASLIKADANKQRSAEGWQEVDWEAMAATRRSVREYLYPTTAAVQLRMRCREGGDSRLSGLGTDVKMRTPALERILGRNLPGRIMPVSFGVQRPLGLVAMDQPAGVIVKADGRK
jgi:transposase